VIEDLVLVRFVDGIEGAQEVAAAQPLRRGPVVDAREAGQEALPVGADRLDGEFREGGRGAFAVVVGRTG